MTSQCCVAYVKVAKWEREDVLTAPTKNQQPELEMEPCEFFIQHVPWGKSRVLFYSYNEYRKQCLSFLPSDQSSPLRTSNWLFPDPVPRLPGARTGRPNLTSTLSPLQLKLLISEMCAPWWNHNSSWHISLSLSKSEPDFEDSWSHVLRLVLSLGSNKSCFVTVTEVWVCFPST